MLKEIKKGNIIVLNDGINYLVLSRVIYNENIYLYLSSVDSTPTLRVCLEKHNNGELSLVPVTDLNLIEQLTPYFKKDIKSLVGK